MPYRHEETNLHRMEKLRTWCSIQMSNIFIVFCSLELLTSVPQSIIVPVTQSYIELKVEIKQIFSKSTP